MSRSWSRGTVSKNSVEYVINKRQRELTLFSDSSNFAVNVSYRRCQNTPPEKDGVNILSLLLDLRHFFCDFLDLFLQLFNLDLGPNKSGASAKKKGVCEELANRVSLYL